LKLTLALISNRPALLRKATLNFADYIREQKIPAKMLVIDDCTETAENQKHLESLAQSPLSEGVGIVHVPGKETRERLAVELEKEVPDASLLFEGNFGGNRNLALLAAATQNEPIVFWDDDVRPLEDCLARHQKLLPEFDVVNGTYAGRTGNLALLFSKLQKALEDQNAARAEEALRGLTDPVGFVREGGYRGGNLGLSLKAIEQCAFFPTSYRCEDAVYCGNAEKFGLKLFPTDALSNEEYFKRTPFVYHNPPAGGIERMGNLWEEGLRSAIVAKCIWEAVNRGALKQELSEQELRQTCEEAPTDVLEALEKSVRERDPRLDELARKVEREDIFKQYIRIVNTEKEKVKPPTEECLNQVKRFLRAQKVWPKLTEAAREKTVRLGKILKV